MLFTLFLDVTAGPAGFNLIAAGTYLLAATFIATGVYEYVRR